MGKLWNSFRKTWTEKPIFLVTIQMEQVFVIGTAGMLNFWIFKTFICQYSYLQKVINSETRKLLWK